MPGLSGGQLLHTIKLLCEGCWFTWQCLLTCLGGGCLLRYTLSKNVKPQVLYYNFSHALHKMFLCPDPGTVIFNSFESTDKWCQPTNRGIWSKTNSIAEQNGSDEITFCHLNRRICRVIFFFILNKHGYPQWGHWRIATKVFGMWGILEVMWMRHHF